MMPLTVRRPFGHGRCRGIFSKGVGLALLAFCFGGDELPADTIILKNGARIESVATWEDGGLIQCFRFGAVIGYPRQDVLKVVPGPVPPAPPSEGAAGEPPGGGARARPAGALQAFPPGGFRLKHLFDGDSLKVTDGNLTIHIRIAGIDAPERGSRKEGIPGQPYSRQAADHLSRLISTRPIRIRGYGIDGYNRQLAEVFAGGRNVGLEMVASGYAEVYTGRMPDGFDSQPYFTAEALARKYGRGIWAQGRMYVSPRAWRAARPR